MKVCKWWGKDGVGFFLFSNWHQFLSTTPYLLYRFCDEETKEIFQLDVYLQTLVSNWKNFDRKFRPEKPKLCLCFYYTNTFYFSVPFCYYFSLCYWRRSFPYVIWIEKKLLHLTYVIPVGKIPKITKFSANRQHVAEKMFIKR